MTDITELALIAKIKKQTENFDTVVLKEDEANALVEALENAQSRDVIQSAKDYHFDQQADRIAELDAELEREREKSRRVMSRIAELESKLANPVQLPKTNGYWTETEKAYEEAITLAKRQIRLAGFRCDEDEKRLDADVSNRNQPGMVVAVHIDVGDFVKFRGRVYEVKETDFDDHDVTLWFVCGEVLKCAAGCPIEVVSAPVEDE